MLVNYYCNALNLQLPCCITGWLCVCCPWLPLTLYKMGFFVALFTVYCEFFTTKCLAATHVWFGGAYNCTNAASLMTLVVSDEQGEWSIERWSEFKPQRRGAGPDERGGSENEQCSAHHVARGTEWMVSFTFFFLFAQLTYVYGQIYSRNLTTDTTFLILACTSTPLWLSGRSVSIL